VAIRKKAVLQSGNLVAKICGNSGKKWQENLDFSPEIVENRKTSGRSFRFQCYMGTSASTW
jgi:hypothetical protein